MAAAQWHVTSQSSDQATITEAGQAITGVRVYFITASGIRGSVLVPDDQYQPDQVAGAIDELANRMEAVNALTEQDVAQAQ